MALRVHWIVLALSLAADRVATAGEVDDLLARVRMGQAELQKLESEQPAVQADREFTIRGKTEKSTYTTYHHGGSMLVLWENRRYCLTAEEAFGVEKPPKSDTYAVLFRTATNPEEYFHKQVGKNYLLIRPLTAAVQSSTVLNVLDRESFKAESVTRDGPDLVTLHYTRPLPGQGGSAVDRGSLTFSTGNHYLLTRFDYVLPVGEGKQARQLRGVMTRKFASRDGRPVVTETSQSLTSTPVDGGDNTIRVRYTYPAQGLSPDEFRLTHYVANPPAAVEVYEDRSFNWPLWGGIAAGCIALSVVLAWFVRRKRKST